MLCRGNDYCFSISVLQSSLQSYPHVSHTVRMKYVDACVHVCVFDECVFNGPSSSQRFVAFLIAHLFVGGLCFPQLCSRKDIEDQRKTLRIYRDTKGIVVKMLITMLTAMYMIVRVVESVRHLE